MDRRWSSSVRLSSHLTGPSGRRRRSVVSLSRIDGRCYVETFGLFHVRESVLVLINSFSSLDRETIKLSGTHRTLSALKWYCAKASGDTMPRARPPSTNQYDPTP